MNDPISEVSIEFVDPIQRADFAYYARAKCWYNSEAACLSLGVDPRCLERVKGAYGPKEAVPQFLEAYSQLMHLVEGHFPGAIASQNSPQFWIDWLKAKKFSCPEELILAVKEFGGVFVDWKSRAEQLDSELNDKTTRIDELEKAVLDVAVNPSSAKRQTDTLLKILIGIALEQYNYDLSKGRNEAAGQISSDLSLHGLSVSDDTIRKYLQQAAEHLP